MILKNEDLQALGMITVALGLSMGWVLDQLHLDFSILKFLEGLFIGLSMGSNLTYLWRRRQGRERSESVELASGQINEVGEMLLRFLRRGILSWLLVVALLSSMPCSAALYPETISRRNIVIDLGDGVVTEAQLTYPSVGEGPFPGVLLVPGSGACNMDEHIPEGTATGELVRPFLQIAEYLSERGFAVLRYNKRGVDLNYADIDLETVLNWTYPILKSDAEKALAALMEQGEVDPEGVSIIGHSEGSFVTSLVAAENPDVKKIVLMGAARHPRELA